MQQTKIIPQRRSKGKKWTECEPHRATRFCLVRGIRILQVYDTMEAAKKNLPSNSHPPLKPMAVGDRYKPDWRGTYAKSLTQHEYTVHKSQGKTWHELLKEEINNA